MIFFPNLESTNLNECECIGYIRALTNTGFFANQLQTKQISKTQSNSKCHDISYQVYEPKEEELNTLASKNKCVINKMQKMQKDTKMIKYKRDKKCKN